MTVFKQVSQNPDFWIAIRLEKVCHVIPNLYDFISAIEQKGIFEEYFHFSSIMNVDCQTSKIKISSKCA